MFGIEHADLVYEVVVELIVDDRLPGFHEAAGFGANAVLLGFIEDTGAYEGIAKKNSHSFMRLAIVCVGMLLLQHKMTGIRSLPPEKRSSRQSSPV